MSKAWDATHRRQAARPCTAPIVFTFSNCVCHRLSGARAQAIVASGNQMWVPTRDVLTCSQTVTLTKQLPRNLTSGTRTDASLLSVRFSTGKTTARRFSSSRLGPLSPMIRYRSPRYPKQRTNRSRKNQQVNPLLSNKRCTLIFAWEQVS